MERQRLPSDSYILEPPPLPTPPSVGDMRNEAYIQSPSRLGKASSLLHTSRSFGNSGEELFTTYGSRVHPSKTKAPVQHQSPPQPRSSVFSSQETSVEESCIANLRTRYSHASTPDRVSPSSMYPEQGSAREESCISNSRTRYSHASTPDLVSPSSMYPEQGSAREESCIANSRTRYSHASTPDLVSPSSMYPEQGSAREESCIANSRTRYSHASTPDLVSPSSMYPEQGSAREESSFRTSTPHQAYSGAPLQTPPSARGLSLSNSRETSRLQTSPYSFGKSRQDYSTFRSPQQSITSSATLGSTENRWRESYTSTSPSPSRRSPRSSRDDDVGTFDISEEFSNTLSGSWVYRPGHAKTPLPGVAPPQTPPSTSLHDLEEIRPKRKISFRYSMLYPTFYTPPSPQTHKKRPWGYQGVGGTPQRRRLSIGVSVLTDTTPPPRASTYSDPRTPAHITRTSPPRRLTQRPIKSPCCNLESLILGTETSNSISPASTPREFRVKASSPMYTQDQTDNDASSASIYYNARSNNTSLPSDYYTSSSTGAKTFTRSRYGHDEDIRPDDTGDSTNFTLRTYPSEPRVPLAGRMPSTEASDRSSGGDISSTHNLTFRTFNSFVEQQQMAVVMFYNSAISQSAAVADWSRPTVLRAPKGASPAFGSVDCATEQVLCAREGIRTHPFYKVYYGGILVNAVKDFGLLMKPRDKRRDKYAEYSSSSSE